MIKRFFETGKWMILAAMLAIVACEESTELEENVVENYVEHALTDMQNEARAGLFGCVELVFPVSVIFPDSSVVEVESYEEKREAVTTWKEANPDVDRRPRLALPFTVVTEDGGMIVIDTRRQLRRLKHRCLHKRLRDRHRDRHRPNHCFKLIYPLTIEFPDGTTESFDDRMALKMGLRDWKAENPETEERPMLSFPVTVEMQDGTTAEVDSKEALRELKNSCSE